MNRPPRVDIIDGTEARFMYPFELADLPDGMDLARVYFPETNFMATFYIHPDLVKEYPRGELNDFLINMAQNGGRP